MLTFRLAVVAAAATAAVAACWRRGYSYDRIIPLACPR
jgi:hypothetical protein